MDGTSKQRLPEHPCSVSGHFRILPKVEATGVMPYTGSGATGVNPRLSCSRTSAGSTSPGISAIPLVLPASVSRWDASLIAGLHCTAVNAAYQARCGGHAAFRLSRAQGSGIQQNGVAAITSPTSGTLTRMSDVGPARDSRRSPPRSGHQSLVSSPRRKSALPSGIWSRSDL